MTNKRKIWFLENVNKINKYEEERNTDTWLQKGQRSTDTEDTII